MKTLIFAGSARKQSYNRQLAQATARIAADAGAEVTHIELADFNIPMYNADLEAEGTPADVLRLKQIMFDHPAWIICAPEYNGSYPALLKNTIDWASSPIKTDPVWKDGFRSFTGQVVGLLSASPGGLGGLRSLTHLSPLMANMQCWVAPKQFALGRAFDAFAEDGSLKQEAHRASVQAVVEQVLWAARKFQA